jgi:hypothetical protein
MNEQQNALLEAKVNDVFQATMKAHNSELVTAQRAYIAKHPAKQ